jgi:hypothetical protein
VARCLPGAGLHTRARVGFWPHHLLGQGLLPPAAVAGCPHRATDHMPSSTPTFWPPVVHRQDAYVFIENVLLSRLLRGSVMTPAAAQGRNHFFGFTGMLYNVN